MFARDLFGLAHRVLHIAFGPRRLGPAQLALHLFEPLGRGGRLSGRARVVAAGGGPAHRVGGLLHLPRRRGEIGPVLLTRQLFELPRRLLGLLGQRALLIAAAARRLTGRASALPLEFLLLAPGQFLQLLGQGIDLLLGLAALGPRRRLVLVGHLVHLELEQVGQVFRDRSGLPAAAPAARLAAGLHLHLVLFFGLLQILQRLLLRRHRALGAPHLQLGLGRLHLSRRERQQVGNLLEGRVGRDQARVHAADEPLDLLAQAALRQRQHDRALAQLVGGDRLLLAQHVERAGDDLALLFRERAYLCAAAPAASAPAGLRRGRLELLAERPHAQEVHVARGLLAAARVVVVGARVVGHRVARLHAEFLEIEGVTGGDLFQALGAAVERHGLLGAAVHRVDEFEATHAEVVVGAGLDHELLHGRCGGVASGLGNRHGGRHVGEHVDHVLRRGRDHRAVWPLQADAVEAVLVGHEAAHERALSGHGQRHLHRLVQGELPGRRRHGGRDCDDHLGAGEHRDVAGIFDDARFEAGVGGEAVFEIDALRVRQIDHVEREGARPHAGGLGHELEPGVEVEDHAFEGAGVVLDHGHALERGGVALAHEQHGVVGGEAAQRGGEELVGAARHRAGAGRERNAIRRGCFETRGPGEHRRQALAQVGRAEREHRQGEGHGAGRHQAVTPHQRLVDAPPRFDLVAALDGFFHQLGDEHR